MRNISFIVSDSGTITAFVNGKSYPIAKDHRYYTEIKQSVIEDDVETFEKFANISASVQTFSNGKVEVKDGQVYYNSQVLHNSVTERILNLMEQGFPFEPVCKFLENLMENPSGRAVKELYNFLSHQHLPITEDGCFLAYKRVRDDWKDFHSGTFDNTIGSKPSVARNQVDDDFRNGCSYGLHVGSIKYVAEFNSDGHVLVVKVNPKDVVSVPDDCNCQKCRVTTYEVLSEYVGDLQKALYSERGEEVKPCSWNNDDDDDDYDDEEDSWNNDDDDDDYDDEEDSWTEDDDDCDDDCDDDDDGDNGNSW